MKPRSSAEKRREKKIARAVEAIGEGWNIGAARARVKTIADMITVLRENGFHLSDKDEAARDAAEALGVPFFIVWLASENFISNDDSADLDDIEEGLRWLEDHKVPRDLLRLKPSRRQRWDAKVEKLNAQAEKIDEQSAQRG